VNPNNVESVNEARDLQAAAQAVGQQITVLKAGNESELDAVFADVVQPRTKAILVGSDALFVALRDQLEALAARYAVPTMYPIREFVVTGGLVSYGNSVPDVPANWTLRWPHPQRREAGRSSCPGADQV
jgi:putative ABC transport system substrate-binding protein